MNIARTAGLDMRLDTSIAKLRRYLVGVLNTSAAESINEVLWVDGGDGSDDNDGKSPDRAKATIAAALALATAYDTVAVFPGTYAEHVDMTVANVTLLGLGDHPREVLLLDTSDSVDEMIGITGSGCIVANLHVQLGHTNNVEAIVIGACDYVEIRNCLFTKYSTVALDEAIRIMGPNTNIKHKISHCEFDTHTLGIVFEDSTTNATAVTIEYCLFQQGVTADITDSADITVPKVYMFFNTHLDAPTDFIVLNSAATTGAMMGCIFDYATHEADVIDIAAGILAVGSLTVAGISTAAPA